jgi:hypothetical protein
MRAGGNMRLNLRTHCFTLLLVQFISQYSVASQTSRLVTIEERGSKADRVLHARVASAKSEKFTNEYGDQLIVTRYKLDVKESLKGQNGSQLEMMMEGGTFNDLTLSVSDLPTVVPGEELVLFLTQTRDGLVPTMRGLGVLKIDPATKLIKNSSLDLSMIRQKIKSQR